MMVNTPNSGHCFEEWDIVLICHLTSVHINQGSITYICISLLQCSHKYSCKKRESLIHLDSLHRFGLHKTPLSTNILKH